MARMIPEDISFVQDATEGERETYRFIKRAAKPDSQISCWFRPVIQGKEPDFVLFSQGQGLLVIEVKDWALGQITKADLHTITLSMGRNDETREHPDRQAKGYVNTLMGELKKIPELMVKLPPMVGKLKIPVGRVSVLPNIGFEELKDVRGLQNIFPRESFLFKEDLDPCGEIWCDPSGRKFRERIEACFPFSFQGLTTAESRRVISMIGPEVRIEQPSRKGLGKEYFQAEVKGLDDVQVRFAKRIGAGHQILKGPPGSGKTLVLVHRCHFLHRYHTRVKKILLVCFNIALVSYLKRLIQEKGMGVGDGGIEVCHFFELAARILNEPVEYENRDSKYYDAVAQTARDAVTENLHDLGQFDAILVDEGQDFDDDMFRAVSGLLAPEGELVIALDAFQDLYRRKSSWKSLGVDVQGRTHSFNNVYRNTVEIFEFTQRFMEEKPRKGSHPSLLREDFSLHGDPPSLPAFPDSDALESFLVEDVKKWIDAKEYTRSEIAILYDDKTYRPTSFQYKSRELPGRILKRLNSAGIPVKWVSKDVRAKEEFDVTTDRVSLVSIHSAKGLDFDLVYLVGIDDIHATPETRGRIRTLLYVAMTRAKHRLVIPYVVESEFIRRMKKSLRA